MDSQTGKMYLEQEVNTLPKYIKQRLVEVPKGQVPELQGMDRKQRRAYYKRNHKALGWKKWSDVNGGNNE